MAATKWHVSVIVSAKSAATAHLPARVGVDTRWLPAGSLVQALRLAGNVGHAMAQLCGATMPDSTMARVHKDRVEIVWGTPNGAVTAIIVRAGTMGEDERTQAYRQGTELPRTPLGD